MLLDQETLRFVFGVKLRGLRLEKGLSLKDLAKQTGLSPSYLNEIEKGKKYPKSEKILLLAHALGEKYENLISLELKKDLQILQTLLDKNILSAIPFDIFGIPAGTVFELLAERPKKMRALIGTLLEITRAHNIHIDDFLFALLRSYLDMHQNYFPSIEQDAAKYRKKHTLALISDHKKMKEKLIDLLRAESNIVVKEENFSRLSSDLSEVFYFIKDRGKTIYLEKNLDIREQIFVLAREIGYSVLKYKIRPQSSLIAQLDSFEQLFHHFSASYFASALLIPEAEMKKNCEELFKLKRWDPEVFERMLQKYLCPHESVFHRLTQILPHHFGLNHLFFLRYEFDRKRKKYEISRELHLSGFEGPHRVKSQENYCSRWLIQKLTSAQLSSQKSFELDLQRSRYAGTDNEYLVLGVAFQKPLSDRMVSSVCLGMLFNEKLIEKMPWAKSAKIPQMVVGETCERCVVENCVDRKAPLDEHLDPRHYERVMNAIDSVR